MGYFSEMATIEPDYEEDHSYPTPELQLIWRLEDLERRLEELNSGMGIKKFGDCRLSKQEVEYALPEDLSEIEDIVYAIDVAREKLSDIANRSRISFINTHVSEVPSNGFSDEFAA